MSDTVNEKPVRPEIASFIASLRLSGFKLSVEDAKVALYTRVARPGETPISAISHEEFTDICQFIDANEQWLLEYLIGGLPAEVAWFAMGGLRSE